MHDTLQTGANISGLDTENVLPETADDMTRDGQRTQAILSDTGAQFGDAMDRAGQQIASDSSSIQSGTTSSESANTTSSSSAPSASSISASATSALNSVANAVSSSFGSSSDSAVKSAKGTTGDDQQEEVTPDVEFPLTAT